MTWKMYRNVGGGGSKKIPKMSGGGIRADARAEHLSFAFPSPYVRGPNTHGFGLGTMSTLYLWKRERFVVGLFLHPSRFSLRPSLPRELFFAASPPPRRGCPLLVVGRSWSASHRGTTLYLGFPLSQKQKTSEMRAPNVTTNRLPSPVPLPRVSGIIAVESAWGRNRSRSSLTRAVASALSR